MGRHSLLVFRLWEDGPAQDQDQEADKEAERQDPRRSPQAGQQGPGQQGPGQPLSLSRILQLEQEVLTITLSIPHAPRGWHVGISPRGVSTLAG